MSRKFSLAYLTIPGICPQDQIRIAAEAGYDFVSLRTISMYLPGEPEYLMDRDPQLFKETKASLEHYNMKLMDIELARVREDLDIADFEKAFGVSRESVPELLHKVVSEGTVVSNTTKIRNGLEGYERVYAYGGKYYVVSGIGKNGFIVDSSINNRDVNKLLESLENRAVIEEMHNYCKSHYCFSPPKYSSLLVGFISKTIKGRRQDKNE